MTRRPTRVSGLGGPPLHGVLTAAALACLLGVLATRGTRAAEATAAKQFAEAHAEYAKGHFGQAAVELKAFLDAWPGSAEAEEATYLLADAYRRTSDWALAEVEYEQLLANYPGSAHVPEATFQLGACLWKQSHGAPFDQETTRKALDRLTRFVSTYPDDPHAGAAEDLIARARDRLAEHLFRIARLYVKLRAFESARLYLADLAADYPGTTWAETGTLLAAESYERENRLGEALAAYQRVSGASRDSTVVREAEKKIARIRKRLSVGSAAAGAG